MQKNMIEAGICTAETEIECGWASVLVCGHEVLDREQGKGVKPAFLILQRRRLLLEKQSPVNMTDLVFGDKVLGLATFMIGVLAGAKGMWGGLVSELVLAEAGKRGIPVVYRKRVPSILNAAGKDICPMERLATECKSEDDFYRELVKRLS